MLKISAFIKRHLALTYCALVFVVSWGGGLIMMGTDGFLGTRQISKVLFVFLAVFAGSTASLAGIFLTSLVDGRAGLRDLLSRFLRWRVGVRWYAVALLTAPLLMMATLLALSLTSPVFLPAIVTTSDKISLLLVGVAVGLAQGFFEELGWTGFAIPVLRKHHDILGTGLIVGLLWGAWHFPLFSSSASSSGAIPPALYVATLLFSWLPPYRVLMVWVYDRTKSLLVVMLMHVPITVSQFVLRPDGALGADLMTYLVIFSGALWVVVATMLRLQTLPRRERGVQPLGITNQKGDTSC